eukprot:226780-Hanusia_phi.AAC.2
MLLPQVERREKTFKSGEQSARWGQASPYRSLDLGVTAYDCGPKEGTRTRTFRLIVLQVGGVAPHVTELAAGLERRGHEVHGEGGGGGANSGVTVAAHSLFEDGRWSDAVRDHRRRAHSQGSDPAGEWLEILALS